MVSPNAPTHVTRPRLSPPLVVVPLELCFQVDQLISCYLLASFDYQPLTSSILALLHPAVTTFCRFLRCLNASQTVSYRLQYRSRVCQPRFAVTWLELRSSSSFPSVWFESCFCLALKAVCFLGRQRLCRPRPHSVSGPTFCFLRRRDLYRYRPRSDTGLAFLHNTYIL